MRFFSISFLILLPSFLFSTEIKLNETNNNFVITSKNTNSVMQHHLQRFESARYLKRMLVLYNEHFLFIFAYLKLKDVKIKNYSFFIFSV